MANENTQIVIAGNPHYKVGFVFGKTPQQFGLHVSLFQRLIERYNSFADSAPEVKVPLFSNQQSSHALSLTPQPHQASPQLSSISSEKAISSKVPASQEIIVQYENPNSKIQLSSSSQATFSQRSKDTNTTTKHQNRRVGDSKVGLPADNQQLPTTSSEQQYLKNWPSLDASSKCSLKTPKYVPLVSKQASSEYSGTQKRRKVSINSFVDEELRKTSQEKKESTCIKSKTSIEATVKKFISSYSFRKHSHCPIDEELLTATLTPSNYKEKFHQLLCREEDEHERILRDKCDGLYQLTLSSIDLCINRHFNWYQNKYKLFCTIWNKQIDADTIAYAMQASEGIVILHLSTGDVQADILQTKDKSSPCFLLGLKTNPGVKRQSNVNVTFVFKYSYFDRLHQVLNNLPQVIFSRLIPSDPCDFSNVHLVINIRLPIPCVRDIVDLEYSQIKALKSIMSCETNKAPVLVVGSFGTGKTQLLARAAYEILQQDRTNKILICAHHQHSADTFVTNYFSKMIASGWRCGEIVRLVPYKDYDYPFACEKYYATIMGGCRKLVLPGHVINGCGV
uniref:Helicase/UvrB N-terminal domain-containing protein n=1 Tax=Amphimedon queenslandica TaxID=400682 RepID=A0A1X7SV71_AMPQE